IEADDKQIEQVLKNIILNALQAMPEGGKLELRTRRLPNQEYVELSVMDTGMGIPEEKLEKIFVPFFTTKTKGTGLGLAVVRKIIENHKGRIEVISKVDEGTSFNIILPVSGAAPLPPIAVPIEEMERRVSADLRRHIDE
ncbi:MAG TPA: ATP-binding protein, partial [Chloroflexota bacterium]|nr:ATP-binding protein [Chloroflexota bacterium]